MTEHLDPTVPALMAAIDSHVTTMAEIDDDHVTAAQAADTRLEAAAAAAWPTTTDTDDQ